jgi:hypothetical protein
MEDVFLSIDRTEQQDSTRNMVIMGGILLLIMLGFVVIGFSGNGETSQPAAAPLTAPVVAAPHGPNTGWVGKSLLTKPGPGPQGGVRIGM